MIQRKRTSGPTRISRIGRLAFAGLSLALAAAVTAACSGSGSNSGGGGNAAPAESTAKSDYTRPVKLIHAVSGGTTELFKELDTAFVANWKQRTGQEATVEQSAGASGAQKDAIVGGTLKADLATLGVGIDIDAIQLAGLVGEGWQQRYDYNSSPFYTAVAFVVRSGNPKALSDWDGLLQGDAKIVTTDPAKDSDARWYYAAPWANSLDRQPDDAAEAESAVAAFHERVVKLAGSDAEAEAAFLGGEGDVWVTTESNHDRQRQGRSNRARSHADGRADRLRDRRQCRRRRIARSRERVRRLPVHGRSPDDRR